MLAQFILVSLFDYFQRRCLGIKEKEQYEKGKEKNSHPLAFLFHLRRCGGIIVELVGSFSKFEWLAVEKQQRNKKETRKKQQGNNIASTNTTTTNKQFFRFDPHELAHLT